MDELTWVVQVLGGPVVKCRLAGDPQRILAEAADNAGERLVSWTPPQVVLHPFRTPHLFSQGLDLWVGMLLAQIVPLVPIDVLITGLPTLDGVLPITIIIIKPRDT